MYAIRIHLRVSGDKFYPNNLDMAGVRESLLRNSLLCEEGDLWNPDDKILVSFGVAREDYSDRTYGYGGLSCGHLENIRKYAYSFTYIGDFVRFLEENDSFFVENGVEEYIIHTDFFYSGPQCNFEMLSIDSITRLKMLKGAIALPVSVYKMKKKQIKELLKP